MNAPANPPKPITCNLSYEDSECRIFMIHGADITHPLLCAFKDGADFASHLQAGTEDEALSDALESDNGLVDDYGDTQRWTAEHSGLALDISVSLGLEEQPADTAALYDAWAAAVRATGIEDSVLEEKRARVVEAMDNAIRVENLESDRILLARISRFLASRPGGMIAMAQAVREGGVDPMESISAARILTEA